MFPSNKKWELTTNCLKNQLCKEMGLVSPLGYIIHTNTMRLEEMGLSKERHVSSFSHSITWLDLDAVENRLLKSSLLVAQSDGSFACIDMFQKENETSSKLKPLKRIFNSSKCKNNHSHRISCIQWYPIDTGMFFSSGMDRKFKVWDTNNLQVVDEYDLKQKIYSHNISPVGNCSNLVSLGLDNGQIRFVDLNSGSFTHTIKAHPSNHCLCIEWSPNRENIVASAGSDGRIAIWDIRKARSCIMYLNFEKTIISKVPPSASYKSLAHSDSIIALQFTQDGHNLVSLGKDNKIRLWDSYTGLNKLVNFGKVVVDEAVSQSRVQIACTKTCFPNYLFLPSGNNLLKFNILSGELKQIYKGHFELINSVCYNSALNETYTGSRDHNVIIWSCDYKKTYDETTKGHSSKRFKANSFPSAHSILSGASRNKEPANQDNWSDDES